MRRHRRRDGSRTRPRFGPRDLVAEAVAGLVQRPGRSALAGLGTVLGVGTVVAILGLTATTSSQIDARFDALVATEVTVKDISAGPDRSVTGEPNAFPVDADQRVQAVNGVVAAGVTWTTRLPEDASVRTAQIEDPNGSQIDVVAASPGLLIAAGARFSQGRTYDAFHEGRRARVAVVGPAVAEQLGISTLDTNPALFIDDVPFTVVGILDDVRRRPELLSEVMIPRRTAEQVFQPSGEDAGSGVHAEMLIATSPGAAEQVAEEAPVALRPDHPEWLRAVPPPNPKQLRSGISADLEQLFLLLAAICLVIGTLGIANTTLVAVLERTGEIGLRRALGARPRHITVQFLTESAMLGTIGGILGAGTGLLVILGVSIANSWTAVLPTGVLLVSPGIGLLTGVVAGLYPAWRAARLQPADALRR